MPRKRLGVEVVAFGLMVAACASPQSFDPDLGAPTDVVDYTMAIQCVGLSNAIKKFQPGQGEFGDGARLGVRYAVWPIVQADIEASRRDFVRDAGKGADWERVGRLETDYAAALDVCRTLADLPDRVVVGG